MCYSNSGSYLQLLQEYITKCKNGEGGGDNMFDIPGENTSYEFILLNPQKLEEDYLHFIGDYLSVSNFFIDTWFKDLG
jgi:hypothetical protein